MRTSTVIAVFMALAAGSAPAMAHSGGLNAQGCHMNRSSGEYHCHRASGSSGQEPVQPTSRLSGAYRNCSEARAVGAAPVYRGQPGYGPHLDRDGDGIGCEPYRGR